MAKRPSPNGANGRDSNGQFTKGNPGGPGNPHGRKVAELRAAFLDAVSARDIKEIVRKMKQQSKKGDMTAARELLDRVLGKASQGVLLEVSQSQQEPQEEQALSHEEELAEYIRFAARFCIPKMAWIPLYLDCYEAWIEGRRTDNRPPDYEELVQLVESRCNWIRMENPPLEATQDAKLTADGQIVPIRRGPRMISGILDLERDPK